MKKCIVALAVMALAIGGTINLTGCGGIADDPDAVKHDAEQKSLPPIEITSDEDLDAEAKKVGYTRDPGTRTNPAPEKKD